MQRLVDVADQVGDPADVDGPLVGLGGRVADLGRARPSGPRRCRAGRACRRRRPGRGRWSARSWARRRGCRCSASSGGCSGTASGGPAALIRSGQTAAAANARRSSSSGVMPAVTSAGTGSSDPPLSRSLAYRGWPLRAAETPARAAGVSSAQATNATTLWPVSIHARPGAADPATAAANTSDATHAGRERGGMRMAAEYTPPGPRRQRPAGPEPISAKRGCRRGGGGDNGPTAVPWALMAVAWAFMARGWFRSWPARRRRAGRHSPRPRSRRSGPDG